MIKRYGIAFVLAFAVTTMIFLIVQSLISLDLQDIDRSEVIRVKPKLVNVKFEKEIEQEPVTIICWFPYLKSKDPTKMPPEIDMGLVSNVNTLVNIPNPEILIDKDRDHISADMLTFKPIRLDQTEVVFPNGIEQTTEEFVVVKYTINQHGDTESVMISESSDKRFELSALNAVEAFKFVPVLYEGEAVIVKDVLQRINYIVRERQ